MTSIPKSGAPTSAPVTSPAPKADKPNENAPLWQPALAMGSIGAAAMVGPSMFPKDKLLQRVGIGAAFGIGALGGVAVEGTVRGLDAMLPGDRMQTQLGVAGAGATLATGIHLLTSRNGGLATGGLAFAKSLSTVFAVGAGAGAAGSFVQRSDDVAANGWVGQASEQVGTAVAAGGLMLGASLMARHAASGDVANLKILESLAVDAKQVGQLAVDNGYLVRGPLTNGADKAFFDKLPESGKRFLTEMPRAEEIRRVMKQPGEVWDPKRNVLMRPGKPEVEIKEPIRAYVGLDHLPATGDELADARTRARMAADELEKLGAFGKFETAADGTRKMIEAPRKSILVDAPTSTGFVNPVAAGAHEMFMYGDTATVSVQVARSKAAAEIPHVARATETHKALVEEISKRLNALPEGVERPKVRLYGESFGAWSSQNGLAGDGGVYRKWLAKTLGKWNGGFDHGKVGIDRLNELGVDQAIYVGTPRFSKFRERMLGSGQAGIVQARSSTDAVLSGMKPDDARQVRIAFLQHTRDPVGLFNYKVFFENFLGRKGHRDPEMPQHQRNLPFISGLQLALDQQNAQKFAPGTIEAKGHDYRGEVPYFLSKILGTGHNDAEIGRVGEWARQVEVLRVKHLEDAKIADPT